MKSSRRQSAKSEKKNEKSAKVADAKKSDPKDEDIEELNQGFSQWLQSGSSVEYMRVFVVVNSLVVFMTMGWPQMQQFFATLMSFFE
ncbi:Hypothetical protein NTJ_05356 [Nesidiocoris tenuis]|uniref:Uncharacterized protein n=1 Tax=Nesidiocoris tenuis TaxID=355587 RepID=A0ABN7AJW5_9HEMI|nr:Hypothetical protein NTJ_05356 [Nesidiocoris tenuis]